MKGNSFLDKGNAAKSFLGRTTQGAIVNKSFCLEQEAELLKKEDYVYLNQFLS